MTVVETTPREAYGCMLRAFRDANHPRALLCATALLRWLDAGSDPAVACFGRRRAAVVCEVDRECRRRLTETEATG